MEMYMDGIDYLDWVNVLPWNKKGRKWGKRNLKDINKIIVHQSLSDGKIESINNYLISPGNHISPGQGCPHICYHICIDKEGQIILCNNFLDRTWHTKGQNKHGIAICVLGNFNGTGWNKGHDPTDEQIKSLKNLIAHLMDKLSFKGQDVYGHYHFGKPACPGKELSKIVESFRRGEDIVEEYNKLDTVEDIQEALLKLGYSLPKWGADGIMGKETKLAICEFQIDTKIEITGYAGEETRHKMTKLLSL